MDKDLIIQSSKRINIFNYIYVIILSFWIVTNQIIVYNRIEMDAWVNLELMVAYAVIYSVLRHFCKRNVLRLRILAYIAYPILVAFVMHIVHTMDNLHSAFYLLAIPLIESRHALKSFGLSLYFFSTVIVYILSFYTSDYVFTFDATMNNIVMLCVFMLYMSITINEILNTESDYYKKIQHAEDISARMNEEKETMNILYDNIRSISKTLDIDEISMQLDKMVGELVWQRSFMLITTLNPEESIFEYYKYVEGHRVDKLESYEYDFIKEVIASNKTIYTEKMFGMVLRVQHNVVGAIILEDFNSDSLTDRYHLLQLLGDQIAAVVNNALMYHNKEIESITDGMTKVYNKKYFKYVLTTMIESKAPNMYLMMFDIDHFKRFNDTYGHHFGDKVLIETAKIVNKTLRDNDFLARYGGEEFAVIIEAPDDDTAFRVAERIRKSVGAMELYNEEYQKNVSVTISIGVGKYQPQWSYQEFVEQVDKCLYESKKAGRNRTTMYIV